MDKDNLARVVYKEIRFISHVVPNIKSQGMILDQVWANENG